MTKDDVIRLAREASHGKPFHGFFPQLDIGLLEAFAKLVAEHEREACAKVCEGEKKWWNGMSHTENDIYQAIDNISSLIRARGQA